MKLVVISDTHQFHDQLVLPEGDVLVHCGDACNEGTEEEFVSFTRWFVRQPYHVKLYVPGNHDFFPYSYPRKARSLLAGANLLIDESITVGELVFYGCPWMPEYMLWSFMLPRGSEELEAKYATIPHMTNVLITHGPPYGILDGWTPLMENRGRYDSIGDSALRLKVERVRPKLHLFGHAHAGYGQMQLEDMPTRFVNASICTEDYHPNNPPTVVEL